MSELSDRDDLRSLERRVAVLERQLAALTAAQQPGPSRADSSAPAAPAADWLAARKAEAERVARAQDALKVPKLLRPQSQLDIEQWLGARGLLLVGVVALLTAAGFFLKYAFDRGWVAPSVRVLGAVVAGLLVAWYGERQVRSGMRRFGLALVGAGGGLVYLGVWAAAGPYQMIVQPAGIAGIAVTAAAAGARAVRHKAEGLALWALLGAFTAPIVLRTAHPDYALFVGYLLIVGMATALVAWRMAWRWALCGGLAGALVLALALGGRALPMPIGFLFLTAVGVAALYLPATAWVETRVLTVVVVWFAFLSYGRDALGIARPAAVAGALLLLLAAWWRHRAVPALRGVRLTTTGAGADELIVFAQGPVICAVVAAEAGGAYLHANPAVSFAAMAALYLATGWRGRWAAFVGWGWALAAVAIALGFHDSGFIWAASAAILAGAAADRWQGQAAITPVTLVIVVFAGLGEVAGVAGARSSEPSFTGAWAVAMYGYLIATVLAASWWRVGPDRAKWASRARGVAWGAAGAVLWVGISIELPGLFGTGVIRDSSADLAGNLAISVWWLLYAALLVRIGFSRSIREVRWAGLAVAGLAAAKIALADLSHLEALYRVAAFFMLALIALAVAYAYNRRAGAPSAAPPAG